MSAPDRRQFFAASAAGASGIAFLDRLPAVSADDAKPDPNLVRLDSGIEPLVRLLEETPREKVLEEVGSRVKKGLAYRDVLAAILLAGVRNVPPRPNVGFKFHAVLVVNSAHQAAMAGPDRERWLPLFWAIDSFKGAQAQTQNEKENKGWRMKPADESKVPTAAKAREAFTAAMDAWDPEAADAAAAGLARTATAGDLFDLFARYGSRDFRDIGHKIIYVCNAFRTLDVIGWHHAEPVLRSLTFAMLKHDGTNPSKADLEPDRPGRKNAERVSKLKSAGRPAKDPAAVTGDLVSVLRAASADDLSAEAARWLELGVPPRQLWDGLFLGGAELLMRAPGIVSLHSLTSLNALHYAARTTGDAELRKFLLLQAAAFVPLFRDAAKAREKGKLGEVRIDTLSPQEGERERDPGAIFAALSKDKTTAAQKALAFLSGNPTGAKELTDEGRRLIFLKGTDAHDYKFSSSVLEDAEFIAPAWRDRFLAASLFWMKGAGSPDSPLVKRTRATLS